jgi:hypothetical protein
MGDFLFTRNSASMDSGMRHESILGYQMKMQVKQENGFLPQPQLQVANVSFHIIRF